MKFPKILKIIPLILVLGCANTRPSAKDSDLEALMNLMVGKFDTGETEQADALTSGLTDWRQRIHNSALGEHVLYLQLNQGPERQLYRQRILVLRKSESSGEIVQSAYSIRDAERFADAGARAFNALSTADLEPLLSADCVQVWTKTQNGFRGYVDPKRCRIISGRTGKPRRIEAETLYTADTLAVAERGFDDDYKQLFGSPIGEFIHLQRISE